jgi:hypothetical protein
MGAKYDEGPEVAPQNFPELAPQHDGSPPYGYQQPYQPYHDTTKPEGYNDGSTYAGTATAASPHGAAAQPFSPHSQHAMTDGSTRKSKGVVCGCSVLVFILSCIIALLSAAVIGLAAGTGVEAKRANDATDRLASMSASLSSAVPTKTATTTAAATPTAWNDIDKGCSNDPDGVSGTTYTSFARTLFLNALASLLMSNDVTNRASVLGNTKFTVFCNRDAPGNTFMSLFTSDMDTCIDTCASYSMNMPKFFGNNKNTTCAGISFIPLWTTKDGAMEGKAPGNCYLKPAPQSFNGLDIPNIGTECHAAILSG